MNRCAVLGSPIGHSMSPVIFATAYSVLGLSDWSYEAFDVDAAGLAGFLAGCGPEWVGLSCTAPLKSELLRHGRASELAQLLNAGNTYVFGRDGEPPRVENTDVSGVARALRRAGVDAAASALIVGAGATARSSMCALSQLGVTSVVALARDAERAASSLGPIAARFGQTLEIRPLEDVPDGRVDVLVRTIPVSLASDYAERLVSATRTSFDVVYHEYPSVLDRAAAAAGVTRLDGLDLLVSQATDQIRLFTGRECPPEPLLDVVRERVVRPVE